jgi:hypothetical protein
MLSQMFLQSFHISGYARFVCQVGVEKNELRTGSKICRCPCIAMTQFFKHVQWYVSKTVFLAWSANVALTMTG